MKKLLFIVLLVCFITNASFAQENKLNNGQIYKNTKVTLSSGVILKGKSLTVQNKNLVISFDSMTKPRTIALADVEQVQIATRNQALVGGLAGAAVGVAAMFIAQSIYEAPETTHDSGYGWTSTTTTIVYMPPEYKIAIVGGGIALGVLIGSTIKGGWKTIYPDKEASKKITLNFSLSNNYHLTPVLAVKYRF